MTTGKTIALTRLTFVSKVMSLLFNMLSRLVIAFLPRSRHLLVSWLQSPFSVILEPKKIKSATVSTVSPCICHEVMGLDAMILVFWILSFKPTFSLSCFSFIKRLFSSSSLSSSCCARIKMQFFFLGSHTSSSGVFGPPQNVIVQLLSVWLFEWSCAVVKEGWAQSLKETLHASVSLFSVSHLPEVCSE